MTLGTEWTREEFQTLLGNPYLTDDELAEKLSGRSPGAIGVVRAGIHAFHKGHDYSILSKMMKSELKEKENSITCPVCHKPLKGATHQE